MNWHLAKFQGFLEFHDKNHLLCSVTATGLDGPVHHARSRVLTASGRWNGGEEPQWDTDEYMEWVIKSWVTLCTHEHVGNKRRKTDQTVLYVSDTGRRGERWSIFNIMMWVAGDHTNTNYRNSSSRFSLFRIWRHWTTRKKVPLNVTAFKESSGPGNHFPEMWSNEGLSLTNRLSEWCLRKAQVCLSLSCFVLHLWI